MQIVQIGSWLGWASGTANIPLSDQAAPFYRAMIAAYRAETGRSDGEIAEPVGGNRTVDQVRAMQAAFDSRSASAMRFWNMDPASKARPGLDSPHIGGNCADIYAVGWSWFTDNNGRNPARFGWRRTRVAQNDLHHFQFFPGTATAALNQTSLENDVSLTQEQDGRLKIVEAGVARFPGNGQVVYRVDDLAVWLGNIMQMVTAVGQKVGAPLDPAEVAKNLAPLLLPTLAQSISSGAITLAQLHAELAKLPAETVKAFGAQLSETAQTP